VLFRSIRTHLAQGSLAVYLLQCLVVQFLLALHDAGILLFQVMLVSSMPARFRLLGPQCTGNDETGVQSSNEFFQRLMASLLQR
jgi:hypothetical protein